MNERAAPTPGVRRAVTGGLSYALGPPLLSALGLPVMAYIIRKLGASAYGEWQTAVSLVAMVTILANLGLRAAFVRAVARDPASAASATAEQLGLRLGLSLVASAIALGACPPLAYSFVVIQCTAAACLGLVLITFVTTLSDLLQALHRLHIVAVIGFVSGLVLTVASGVAVWLGAGPVVLAATYLVGPLLGAIMSAVVVSRGHFPVRVSFSAERWRALLMGSRHFTAQQVIGAISANATSVLLPAMAGSASFGFFAAGSLLAMRLAAIPEGLTTAFYPVLAADFAMSVGAARRRAIRLMLMSLGICIGLAALVTVLADPVAGWLFPSRPEVCARVMRVTIWSLPLLAIGGTMGYVLNAAGRDALHAKLTLVVASLNLLLTVVLVTGSGPIGAGWALIGRYLVLISLFTPSFLRCIADRSEVAACSPAPA